MNLNPKKFRGSVEEIQVGFGVQGLRFRVWGSGFGVQGLVVI